MRKVNLGRKEENRICRRRVASESGESGVWNIIEVTEEDLCSVFKKDSVVSCVNAIDG